MESLYAAHLQDILLSWDYWELERSCRNGGGPIEELPTIPIQFSSAEVGVLGQRGLHPVPADGADAEAFAIGTRCFTCDAGIHVCF